jgi:hypothetical protein
MITDFNKKQEDDIIFFNGQDNSSDKINTCKDHYKALFENHKIIDITDNININNSFV